MITWIKESGVEIETNDRKETVAGAIAAGWKRAGGEDKPKRTRRTKEQIEADKAADNG